MPLNIRNVPGHNVLDPSAIANNEYSDASGAKKVAEVGKHLLPFPYDNSGTIAYTTDLSTALPLPKKGLNLAVYNKDTAVHAVTLKAGSAPTALAAGVTDSAGLVGIPCAPGTWTYIATGAQNWVITDNNNLLVFIIDDNSQVVNQIPAQVPNY